MQWTCPQCGLTVTVPNGVTGVVCSCNGKARQRVGVGHELKKLLRLLGYTDVPGCQCSKHAAAMDGKGIEWCKENVDTIVGWLREEAERREKRFSEKGAKALVWVAIRKAQLRRFLNERVSKSV